MSEHHESTPKKSKGNPVVNYVQESFQELQKVTWPTRNKAVKLTFIVIGFCLVFALFVGGLDFAFNTGYRSLVTLSNQINPAPITPVTQPASGEPTSSMDLSNIKVNPTAIPTAPVGDIKVSGSTQQ